MQVLVGRVLELANYQINGTVGAGREGMSKEMCVVFVRPAVHCTGNFSLTKERFNDSYLDPREGESIQLSMRTRSVYILRKPWQPRPLALNFLILLVSLASLAPCRLPLLPRLCTTRNLPREGIVSRSKCWAASVSLSVEDR